MNKITIAIIISIILVVFLFWALNYGFLKNNKNLIPEGIIFFYGEKCFYCKNVEEFISQNKIEENIDFIKLEVWNNKENQAVLMEVAKKCGIDPNNVGIPLLYDSNKCFSGDVDVIKFFQDKVSITN